MEPVVYFSFETNGGLGIKLLNLSSSPIPITSFKWTLGDGTTNTTNDVYEHTYASPGKYTIKLEVENSEGKGELSRTINIGPGELSIDVNLITLIDSYMPSILIGSSSIEEKINLINKWQEYLQPQLCIPIDKTHNELAWPYLANHLIAQLVTYDMILAVFQKFMLYGIITNSEREVTGENGLVNKQIKMIETGPTKTEWFERKSAEEMKEIALALGFLGRPDNMLSLITEGMCSLADRLTVYLPMCNVKNNVIIPKVLKRNKRSGHNANPFGITKRMV